MELGVNQSLMKSESVKVCNTELEKASNPDGVNAQTVRTAQRAAISRSDKVWFTKGPSHKICMFKYSLECLG